MIAEGLKGKKLQTRVHIQDIGWTRWTSGMIGTVGMNKKIEAIELEIGIKTSSLRNEGRMKKNILYHLNLNALVTH